MNSVSVAIPMPVNFDNLPASSDKIREAANRQDRSAAYTRAEVRHPGWKKEVHLFASICRGRNNEDDFECSLTPGRGAVIFVNQDERPCWCDVEIELDGTGAQFFEVTFEHDPSKSIRIDGKDPTGQASGLTGEAIRCFHLRRNSQNPPVKDRQFPLELRIVSKLRLREDANISAPQFTEPPMLLRVNVKG